jgi:hypothetical protein
VQQIINVIRFYFWARETRTKVYCSLSCSELEDEDEEGRGKRVTLAGIASQILTQDFFASQFPLFSFPGYAPLYQQSHRSAGL